MQHYSFKYPPCLPKRVRDKLWQTGNSPKGEPEPPKRANSPLGIRGNDEEIFKNREFS